VGKKLPNPYYIFVSEFMLQQTTVNAVIPKFNEFIRIWPTIEELSKIRGTREFHEKKFKDTYESPSSKFRTKKLKQIGNEIKTINTTFSKRTRRGRIRKITREELIHK